MKKKAICTLLAVCMLLQTFSFLAVAKAPQEMPKMEKKGAANVQTYITDEGKTHTLYWAKGIDAPTIETKQNPNPAYGLKKYTERYNVGQPNELVYSFYAMGFTPGHGWYDINKIDAQGIDSNMCFAVASANLMQWWLEQNRENIDRYLALHPQNAPGLRAPQDVELYRKPPETVFGKDSSVYALYRNVFNIPNKKGYHPDFCMDFFLNGYKPDFNAYPPSKPANFVPDGRAGFFYPVFGKELLTTYDLTAQIYEEFNRNLKQWFLDGRGVVLALDMMGTSHAITIWGAEYDENGNLIRIFTSDSDNLDEYLVQSGPAVRESMQSFNVISDAQGYVRFSTLENRKNPNEGSALQAIYTVSLGERQWEEYFAKQEGSLLKGDVNKDGRITQADYDAMILNTKNLDYVPENEDALYVQDLNEDGAVDAFDLALLCRKLD